jgi:hypothetical protein
MLVVLFCVSPILGADIDDRVSKLEEQNEQIIMLLNQLLERDQIAVQTVEIPPDSLSSPQEQPGGMQLCPDCKGVMDGVHGVDKEDWTPTEDGGWTVPIPNHPFGGVQSIYPADHPKAQEAILIPSLDWRPAPPVSRGSTQPKTPSVPLRVPNTRIPYSGPYYSPGGG